MLRDERMVGKQHARTRARKAREDETGHDREKGQAGENLDRREQMRVIRLRVHVAVADGGKRLDRKIEEIAETAGPRICDRFVAQEIKGGVNGVDRQKGQRGESKELKPRDRQRGVVEVTPEIPPQTPGEKVPRAEANLARRCSPG